MQMGKLLKVENGRIDLSEIPFLKYLNKNINLTLISHNEFKDAKINSICMPFTRSVYSIWTNTRLALGHYMDLQELPKIKKLIKKGKLPGIKCKCKQSKNEEQYFRLSYKEEETHMGKEIDKIETPILLCVHCGENWGELPDEVLDIYLGRKDYDGIRKEKEIIVPFDATIEDETLIWVIFDDEHIDWNREGKVWVI